MLILYYVHIFIIYNIYIYIIHTIQIYNPYSFAGCQLANLSRFTRSNHLGIPRLAHAHTGREATRLSQENVASAMFGAWISQHDEKHQDIHQNTESVCGFFFAK